MVLLGFLLGAALTRKFLDAVVVLRAGDGICRFFSGKEVMDLYEEVYGVIPC